MRRTKKMLSHLWLRDVDGALVVDGRDAPPHDAALRGDLAGVSARLDSPGWREEKNQLECNGIWDAVCYRVPGSKF